jgi:hypothetical protein
MEIYKCVIPQYLLASQKLDFLCFTEGLYKMAQRFLPNASAEDRAVWCFLSCFCFHLVPYIDNAVIHRYMFHTAISPRHMLHIGEILARTIVESEV